MDSLYRNEKGVLGAASCATSACHGGPKAGVASAVAPRGSEYPLWFESDPHARSWKTLCSEASLQIMTKLGIFRDGKIADIAGYRNCLACHNSEKNLSDDQLTPTIAEGVGCEACHGPSEKWYDRHYQGLDSANAARRDFGLTDSRPLLQRAKICATCHVGGKDRDMNHDIIAAGHPALYFDMAVYHEAYPKHWRDADQYDADFRAKLWLAGQIASADSELELMETRACKSLPISTWPELSMYQCSSCHFSLDGQSKTTASDNRDRVDLGRASVRQWNLVGLFQALDPAGFATTNTNVNRARDAATVQELRALLNLANPDSRQVSVAARKLRVELASTLWDNGKLSLPDWSRQKQMAQSIRLLEASKRNGSWESAATAYAATWATHPTLSQQNIEKPMMVLRAGLLFPEDAMTPRFPRSRIERVPPSLKDWDESLLQLVSALKNEIR